MLIRLMSFSMAIRWSMKGLQSDVTFRLTQYVQTASETFVCLLQLAHDRLGLFTMLCALAPARFGLQVMSREILSWPKMLSLHSPRHK